MKNREHRLVHPGFEGEIPQEMRPQVGLESFQE